MDRYSDVMYLAAAALSIIGSIFAGIYTKITRVAPERAGELATSVLDIGERARHATSTQALDALQEELDDVLRLGYQPVRGEISTRRDYLKQHPGDSVW